MNHPKVNPPVSQLSYPRIIGFMSVDGAREYHGDTSQLKFLNNIPKEVNMDLNHRINEALKRTTDENDEKIKLLLMFLIDRFQCLPHTMSHRFISYRRSLINVMCSVYSSEHVRIVASLLNGSIYLCTLETSEELIRRQRRSEQEKKFCAWGYKFEQYMLSDLPDVSPDIEKPVVENEEFTLYFHSYLNQHELIYGAQIDGLLATNTKVEHPPKTKDFETNLNYLQNHCYIELKTNRELHNQRQEHNFKRYKLLRCWCQCYLAGLEGLLVGFRNDDGIVKRLRFYKTEEIVSYCKREWSAQKIVDFLNYFLSYIKNTFTDHYDKYPKDNTKTNSELVSYYFDIYGSNSIQVSRCENPLDEILPEWYMEAVRNKTNFTM